MAGKYRRWYEDDLVLNSEEAPGGVIVYYADGGEEIIHVNQYVIDLFECASVDEFLDLVGGSFRGFVHGEDIDSAEDSIWGQVEKHDNLDHINYRIETKTGKLVNIEDFGRLVETKDGRPIFYVFIIKAEQRGTVDWLTGLPSMARFHELAEMGAATLRARGERPVAVALDLVGMKAFNTQYGRDEGDVLLCAFGDVLRKHFGSEACSRFAEDHFYAFSTYEGIDDRIEALFSDFKSVNGGKVLPIRSGSYVCEDHDDIIEVGFDRAKIACDLDRTTWQSHNMWFSEDMRAKAHLRIHVLAHVDQAVEEGWIRPHYQSLVRSTTGNACGEEALARWVDPEYGELSPSQFVPVLEEAGLLHKVDMRIVECVMADIVKKWERGVPVVPVSVNISPRDFDELNVVEEIKRAADDAGVPHSLLRIEFTESAASNDSGSFKSQVKALHEAGFRVWMDDFGSGYSSLNLLQEYAFDLIKLDMGFIKNVESEKAREIVGGVVRVAKKLGVATLAEGVETVEQALFLESIGCDALQGYYFTHPIPLEEVISRFERGVGLVREDPSEMEYWDIIGAVDLVDPTANIEGHAVDGTMLSEFPAGIVECRDGTWSIMRTNEAYRNFLERVGLMSEDWSDLKTNPILDAGDEEFLTAAKRSAESGTWERIAGRLEYGTGLQFYTRPIASTQGAEAFLLAAVPTMLGTALGSYGDVPVAYTVLRVLLAEDGVEVADVEYVYANSVYCEWGGFDHGKLMGRSLIEVNGPESRRWFPYCRQAAIDKEAVQDTVYGEEIGHWINFRMVPSPVEGCCVFAYAIADEEQRERQEMLVDRDTSDFIVDIAGEFNSKESFEDAMNAVLAMMSRVINPKRLFVFERSAGTDWVTFEWCADSADSQIGTEHSDESGKFGVWDDLAEDGTVIYIPDIEALEPIDKGLYDKLKGDGVTHMLATPLYDGKTVIGNLVAENYEFEQGIDVKRMLETAASFISAQIVNHRLLAELERAGTHDALTGLLNRGGFDNVIAERLAASPDEPYTLALMDIDDFKIVNDLHGHDVGDAALRALSAAVRTVMPADAVLGRNGGDELVAMLFGQDAAAVDAVFERFSAMQLGCEHNGRCYPLSMSIGYASVPDEASDLKDVYSKADAALYAVKLAGKAGHKRYTPDIESQYRSQLGFTPRDIAENIPGAILVHRASGEGEILFANDELIDLFECANLDEFMEYTGGVFKNIVHPDDNARVYEELTRQLSLDDIGFKNFANYRIITKEGNVRHVANNGRLVEVEGVGKVFYVLIINRDERDIA